MIHRQKQSGWSHNERFAHKKNTGEEARLRDEMFRLDMKFGQVKESIRQEAGQVRTALKHLRKSTGHSIEALPPTPFQMTVRRDSTFITLDMTCDSRTDDNSYNNEWGHSDRRNYTRSQTDDELSIAGVENGSNEFQTKQAETIRRDLNITLSSSPTCLPTQTLHDNTDNDTPSSPTCLPTQTLHDNTDNDTRRTTYKAFFAETSRVKRTLHTMPGIDNRGTLVNARQGQQNYVETPAVEIKARRGIGNVINMKSHGNDLAKQKSHGNDLAKLSPVTYKRSNNGVTYLGDEGGLVKEGTAHFSPFVENDATNGMKHIDTNNQTSQQTFISIPYSREGGVSHNTSSPHKHVSRRTTEMTRAGPTRHDRTQTTVMRNARTRCRTCLERFQQNKEFDRQRKLEQEHQVKVMVTEKGNKPALTVDDKPFLMTDGELNSLFAETEVLDFEESKTDKYRQRDKRNNGPKKGFSRTRLEQLAEPRRGRRKKMLFSKHVIKKEMDCLTEKHSQPQLIEREKERLRVVESKIRMFLAVTTSSLMPSAMVHIPQREDIMTVDISHL